MYQFTILVLLGSLLAPLSISTATSSGFNFIPSTQDDGLLTVEQAYQFFATVVASDQLRLTWTIAKGTYLYKELTHVTLLHPTPQPPPPDRRGVASENADEVELGPIIWPAGVVKHNAVRPNGDIGDVEAYHDSIDLQVPLRRTSAAPQQITLLVRYQGCAELGICYPPIVKRVALNLPATPPPGPLPLTGEGGRDEGRGGVRNEQDVLAAKLHQGNWVWIVATFFGLGLLLAFTPCVLPMIPILSGIIVGQGKDLTPQRAFWLSLVYVLAMACTYTVAGILAGLFGSNLQAAFQNQWIIGSFALLFVVLALAMFDLYELQLPTMLQTRVTNLSNTQQGGSLAGVAIMGLLSALIVGPCIAPPLAGTLIYIGQTGDALLGGVALFALSMGMGAPLLVIGTSAGSLIPRAGAWMNVVKTVFGVMLLGVAITLLDRIVSPYVIMLLWGTLLICVAVFMGALRSSPPGARNDWNTLWQGLGIVLLIYGTLLLVGASAGGQDLFKPLQGILVNSDTSRAKMTVAFASITTAAELDAALAKATAESRPVMLDFYADWCVSCKEFERYTLADATVQNILGNFMLLRIDVTANDANSQALQSRFKLVGPPAVIFYNRAGMEQQGMRVIGFIPVAELITRLKQVMQ